MEFGAFMMLWGRASLYGTLLSCGSEDEYMIDEDYELEPQVTL